MDIEAIINHEYGIRTGLAVARLVPKSVTYRLARFLSGRVAARRDQPMVKAVRANQWVVSGGKASADELDAAVRKTFEYRAYSIADLYHNIQVEDRISNAVVFDDGALELIELSKQHSQGVVIVIPHVANYELAGLAAALKGGMGVALTMPEQPGGYKYHDKIRKEFGIDAVPASMSSFKYATEALKEGAMVGTGVDRPLPDTRYRPRFFGRPAGLPVHYVVLALRAQVPMVFAAVRRRADGKYQVSRSEALQVKEYRDRKTTIIANAERLLERCEAHIRQDPYQWAMFFPVWPEVDPDESP